MNLIVRVPNCRVRPPARFSDHGASHGAHPRGLLFQAMYRRGAGLAPPLSATEHCEATVTRHASRLRTVGKLCPGRHQHRSEERSGAPESPRLPLLASLVGLGQRQ